MARLKLVAQDETIFVQKSLEDLSKQVTEMWFSISATKTKRSI